MVKRPRTITIAGGGLVGSLLGVMLGQRGYRVDIFERRSDMRKQDVDAGRSINLALSERGIYALKMAGLMEQVERLLIPMSGRMLHDESGKLEFLPYGQRPHEVIFSVSRELLNSLMMTAAEKAPDVNLHFNQQCESIDLLNNRMTIRDAVSGACREVEFEILIGADGAGSKVRQSMIPVNGGSSVSEFLDHDYKELEIPPAPDGSHRILREALHIWPRGEYMLIALPNLDGSFTVTLFMPRSGEPGFESLRDVETVSRFFEAVFPDAAELMPELSTDFFQNPQGRLGTLRCQPWYFRDDVLIVGDASHAIVPFHGQGMNSGFEDCSELVRLLDQGGDEWGTVIREFDQIRRPNTEAIADMALENYVTMRDSVRDPKFQLKKEIGFELEKKFPGRFVPRYSMVMFHRIPYADAFSRGKIESDILDQLSANAASLAEVDFDLAEQLVIQKLPPVDVM